MQKYRYQSKCYQRLTNWEYRMRLATYGSTGLLALLGIITFFPIAPVSADAAEPAPQSSGSSPSLSVSLQQSIDFNITPTSTGEFTAGIAKVYVSTDNSGGYSISLATNNGRNTLDGVSNNDAVRPIGGVVTPENFTNNTWGYAFGQGEIDTHTATYKALPVSMTEVANSTSASANDQYTLAFGAKVNTAIPSGYYSNSVNVRVIAKPVSEPDPTWASITTMQEMTAAICEAAATGASKSLTDTRNSKVYTVFKAKDGNCWMKSNLALSAGTYPATKVAGGIGGNYTLADEVNMWDGAEFDSYKPEYGYYYNFDAATAGTGTSSGYTNAAASICPTGGEADANWVLPLSGSYNDGGSFKYYLQQTSVTTYGALAGALNFYCSGIISGDIKSLYYAGSEGFYLSRTSYGSAYALYFWNYPANPERIVPNQAVSFDNGASVRCLYPSTSTKAAVQAQ